MKRIIHQTAIEVYDSVEDLAESEKRLIATAIASLANAYAPYSGFRVGSAVLLSNGETITGSNQENAVFPLGLCAERVALFTAANLYPDVPVIALALATEKILKEDELPVFPCGSCRQVMIETETRFNHTIRLLVHGSNGKTYIVPDVPDILPFAMTSKTLE